MPRGRGGPPRRFFRRNFRGGRGPPRRPRSQDGQVSKQVKGLAWLFAEFMWWMSLYLYIFVQNVSEGEGREARGDGPQGGRPPRPRYRRRLPRQSRGPPRNSQSEGEGKGKVCHNIDYCGLSHHFLQPNFSSYFNDYLGFI